MNKSPKTFTYIISLLVVCFITLPALAKTNNDTEAARREAALAYLKVQPMSTVMDEMAEQFSKQMKPEASKRFKTSMKNFIDVKALESAAVDAMAKNFTVDEIKALTKFYASPEGRSVMKKMPDYMRELMPHIQNQIGRFLQSQQEAKKPAGKQEAKAAN